MSKNFMGDLCDFLNEKEGAEYDFCVTEVTKRNNVQRTALCVKKKNGSFAANLYEQDLEKMHEKNAEEIEITAEQVMMIVRGSWVDNNGEDWVKKWVEGIRDYSIAKDQVLFEILNLEANEKELRNVAHVPFLDLVIVFYFVIGEGRERGRIHLPWEIFQNWNVDVEEVLEKAKENAERLLPHCCVGMQEVLSKDPFMSFMNAPEHATDNHMFVLTNSEAAMGAATILYPGVLKSLAEQFQDDKIIILPSSVHECILMPSSETVNLQWLKEIVREVNDTEINPEERLSDSLYLYLAKEDRIVIWEEESND